MRMLNALAAACFFLIASSSYAAGPAPALHGDVPPSMHEMRDKIKNMSEEERKAFFAQKKTEWDAMSKEQKLAEIEKRRAERIKMMEDEWNTMSDDEKIAHVEKKMKGMAEGKGCHGMWHHGPEGMKPGQNAPHAAE